jgi:translation initiation factor IF-1
MEMRGVLQECMGGGKYKVLVTEGQNIVIAQLSGRLRNNHIRVTPGDAVTVAVSPYDTSNGIIVYRGEDRRRRAN